MAGMGSVGTWLRRTFRLCRSQAPALLLASALLMVPIAAIRFLAALAIGGQEGWLGWARTAGEVAMFVVECSAMSLSAGAVTAMARQIEEGKTADVQAAWVASLGRARPLVTASLAVMLVMMPVFMVAGIATGLAAGASSFGAEPPTPWPFLGALLIAVLFVSLRYPLVTAVALVEGAGGWKALRRHKEIARGRRLLLVAVFAPLALLELVPVALPEGPGWQLLGSLWTSAASVPFAVAAALLYPALVSPPVGDAAPSA